MDTNIHHNHHWIYYIVNWLIAIHPWLYRWRGYATTNNNNNTPRKICNTHPSTNALSPPLLYTHGNTIINILILQIVFCYMKATIISFVGWGGECITTNIYQTIHNNNPRSRDLSPGITTALYDVLCQPNAHHITQDIL